MQTKEDIHKRNWFSKGRKGTTFVNFCGTNECTLRLERWLDSPDHWKLTTSTEWVWSRSWTHREWLKEVNFCGTNECTLRKERVARTRGWPKLYSSYVVVVGATEQPVSSAEEALSWLEVGNTARITGATQMNQRSSRSHAVFTILISKLLLHQECVMMSL